MSDAQAANIQEGYAQAQLQALKTALLWAAGFALVGLWFALACPESRWRSMNLIFKEGWWPVAPPPQRALSP